MKRANVSSLKNRLSEYLRLVRRGETVRIYDRDEPVADIIPFRLSDQAGASHEKWHELVADGLVTMGKKFGQPTPDLSKMVNDLQDRLRGKNLPLVETLLKERGEGW